MSGDAIIEDRPVAQRLSEATKHTGRTWIAVCRQILADQRKDRGNVPHAR